VFVASREAARDRGVYHADRWAEINALAFVPLVANDVVLGVIGLGFEQPREFDTSEREFVDLFAGHAARAIARDREDRLERLRAEASAALASSLDANVIMKRIGELSVGMFADWCFVDLVRDGEFERVVVAHADPADAPIAEKIRAFGPARDHIPTAISSHRPVTIRIVDDAVLQRIAHSPGHLEALRGTRVRSFISVPMVVGGRAIGAASWISQSRTFDDRDVRLAIQLGHAAAAAVENARLYSAEADAARRVHKLYELSVSLSSARTPEEVADATARLGREAIGASSIMIWVRDTEGVLRLVGASSPSEWRQQWTVLSNDPELPANRVIATGEPIFVETPRDYASKASVVFQRVQEAGRVNPFAALPLSIAGERTGVIAISFTGEHRFVPDERTFLFAIARGCEQALERASLYAAEARARANAESASRAKDEFLAMLGHELRNPLAPIVSALELMRMRNVGDGGRERAVIERQVSHLMRLVDDLLDISRITRGKIELRRTVEELSRAVEPAVDSVAGLLVQQRHQITVLVPQGLLVDADMSRLSQVVRHLMTNAAKFTPAGGHITVAARVDGDWIELIVQDTGRGIAPELMPHVFEPFVQGAQAVDRAGGGLGLGLSIARNLVQLHGGTLRLESSGTGTTAIARLPRAKRTAEPHAPSEGVKASRSLRVLIVDDNVDAAMLLAELLRALGHDPIIAHDGPGALGSVSSNQPQLAILDIGLPGMDGYELAKQLHSVPGLEHVPVVALTGYGQPSDRDRSLAAGFEDHLVKPIDLGRLQSLFARLTS
jgi:signal transduction histidine kinase/CheY-like chemotaxis protein